MGGGGSPNPHLSSEVYMHMESSKLLPFTKEDKGEGPRLKLAHGGLI